MEWSVLFVGPVGAGKTQAIRAVSDIEVVDTEAFATDATALVKARTTVAMDMGTVRLGPSDRLRLYGAPGQRRFDFMWDILLEQSRGVVLLVNHRSPTAVADLTFHLEQVRARMSTGPKPLVIGITHVDAAPGLPFEAYAAQLGNKPCNCNLCRPPLVRVDARDRREVSRLLLTLAAMLEMTARFPRALHARHAP